MDFKRFIELVLASNTVKVGLLLMLAGVASILGLGVEVTAGIIAVATGAGFVNLRIIIDELNRYAPKK